MKRATIHLICDGEPVDFEVHDDGEIEVPGYDIEADMAAAELGFEPTECLTAYLQMTEEPYRFIKRHKMLPPIFQETAPMLGLEAAIFEKDVAVLLDKPPGFMVSVTGDGDVWVYLSEDESPRVRAAKEGVKLSRSLMKILNSAWKRSIWDIVFFDT